MRIIKTLVLATSLIASLAVASPTINSVRNASFYTDPSRTFAQVLEYSPMCDGEFQGWDEYMSPEGREVVWFKCTVSDRAMRAFGPRFARLSTDRGELQEADIELHFVLGADGYIHPYETRITIYWDNLKQTIWERGERDMVYRAYQSVAGQYNHEMEMILNFIRFINNEKIPLK